MKTTANFEVLKVKEIPEIQVVLTELVHTPTGAQVIHLAADDPENVFCLSFKTIPETSDGVAHILEHIVLAGSEKFPVRDPFFSMTRRSLNTFMNAFTGSDFTCYPAASQVEQDFYNLLEVYLDAVFHPTLDRFSFLQEGHRLDFEEDKLVFKGVVFNEMKGALSSPVSRLFNFITEALYPDITYGQNSGGDPKVIPDLTYEQLVDFHKTFYHPSRCLFFFYGDIPLEKHLDFIERHALQGVPKLASLPLIPKQKRFKTPKYLERSYPADDPESLTYVSFSWITCPIADQEKVLALTILDTMLMGTDAALLKMALLKSGLCSSLFSFLETDMTEIPYGLILNGCKAEEADRIEELLFDTLQEIVKVGFSKELIESAIHQIEFERTEITEEGYPHGLNLFMRAVLLKQHDIDPEEGLKIHTLFDQLRKQPRDYFQRLLQETLIDNPHRVRIVMTPDPALAERESQEELAKLEQIQKTLTEGEIATIKQEAAALHERQEEEGDDSILPKLSLKEVPSEPKNFALQKERLGELEVYHHDCFTNGILYADASFALPTVAEKQWPLLRLFASLLSQMGCAGRDYRAQLETLQAHTGSLAAMLGTHPHALDPNSFTPTLSLRGKALYRNGHKLLELIEEMITSVDFTDTSRLGEVIQKQATQFKSALASQAMGYAKNLAASSLRASANLNNGCFGLPYYKYIIHLAEHFSDRPEAIVGQLQEMQQMLLTTPDIVIGCDSVFYKTIRGHSLFDLRRRPKSPWKNPEPPKPMPSQGLIIPSPVAFTSVALPGIPYVHPDTPALSVASQLFEHITLHTRIREQGGAYGSGAGNKAIQGIFQFYGYRDPNIDSTLRAFREAIENVINDDFTDEELESAKLEMLQSIDSPISPGSRADTAYIWEIEERTLVRRRHFRDGVINLERGHLKEAVEKHLLPHLEKGVTITLAGRDLLERENAKLLTPLEIHEI